MPMGTVHTLYLAGSDMPVVGPLTTWLVAAERAELALLSDERRRSQWLGGRWVAKQLLVQAGTARCASDVEICSRDEWRRGSRPRIRIGGQPLVGSLSIAHTAKGALAALTSNEHLVMGVDLVDLADVAGLLATSGGRGFAELWFTPLERSWIAGDRLRRTATLWGIKEAVYKACQLGEGWTPRDVVMWPREGGGYRCFYHGNPIDSLHLEVGEIDEQLAVVASVLPGGTQPAEGGGAQPEQTTQQWTGVFTDFLQHELIVGQAS
ncbi:MAG TPA: 4'-phosphopantetheinyl transferase superfamily protein [Pirellulales bacterium]